MALSEVRVLALPDGRKEMKTDIELPDIGFCKACGLVVFNEPNAPFGMTKAGKIRVTRKGGHSYAEYMQKYHRKFYAMGLTARGTVRKYKLKKLPA